MQAIAELQEIRDRTRWLSVSVGAVLGELDEFVEGLEDDEVRDFVREHRPVLSDLCQRLRQMEARIEERIEPIRRRSGAEPAGKAEPWLAAVAAPVTERPAPRAASRGAPWPVQALGAFFAMLLLASPLAAQAPGAEEHAAHHDSAAVAPAPETAPHTAPETGGRMQGMMGPEGMMPGQGMMMSPQGMAPGQGMMGLQDMGRRHCEMMAQTDSLLSGVERMRLRARDSELRGMLDEHRRRMADMRRRMGEMQAMMGQMQGGGMMDCPAVGVAPNAGEDSEEDRGTE